MKTVVATTDVFRCREFGVRSVAENARWLLGLFYASFPPDRFKQSIFVSESDLGEFRAAEFRRSHAIPADKRGWASLVNAVIPKNDEDYFADLLTASLVIGWGLTPALIELLHRNDVAVVDFEIDPIRFSDDIFLRIRTNEPRLSAYLSALHIDDAAFRTSVAEIRGIVCRNDASAIKQSRSYAVFAGQCQVDLSVVSSGWLVAPAEHIDQIRAIAKNVEILAVKPHPYDDDPRHVEVLLNLIPNACLTRSNIYRLLSDTNCNHALGLSSSVLDEAALFGVATTRLISPDRDASDLIPNALSPWYRVSAEVVADGSLSRVLFGGGSASCNLPSRRIDLRRSFQLGWGLSDLYTEDAMRLSFEPGRHRLRDRVLTRRSFGRALKAMVAR